MKLKYVWIKASLNRIVNHNTKPQCCQWNRRLWINYTNKMISDKFLKTTIDGKCSIYSKYSKNIFRSQKISRYKENMSTAFWKTRWKVQSICFSTTLNHLCKAVCRHSNWFLKKKTKIIESVCFRYDEEREHLWRKQITFEGK